MQVMSSPSGTGTQGGAQPSEPIAAIPDPRRLANIAKDWENDKKIDLVCEGGGVRGIALVGAYSVLEERGYQPQNLAGTSAGAIVATLIAADYKAEEIRKIIWDIDFSRLLDPTWEKAYIPLLGDLVSIIKERGLYKGDAFVQEMRDNLEPRGKQRFADLVWNASAGIDSVYRYKVNVIASDVTGEMLLRLPVDVSQFGIDPDELSVADAVRMSMAIPFFFKPFTLTSGVTKAGQAGSTGVKPQTVVDGGLLSNFPVWIFDVSGLPPWPTFGLKMVAANQTDQIGGFLEATPLGGTIDYVKRLFDTMMTFHDRLYLDTHSAARTIAIPTGAISSTNFDLTDKDKQQLFDAGRQAATNFLDDFWDFEGYLAAFRVDPAKRPTRTGLIRDAMRAAIPPA
jgi:NTE family protein